MADVGPTPECPCGAKISDAQKNAINWGRDNPVFQNPVASQINNAQGGFAAGTAKANAINGLFGANPQITKLISRVGNMQSVLDRYRNETNRLSGVSNDSDGPDLLSLVSTVGAAVNLQCALGIDGLDVGAKIGIVTEDGKMKLNVAIDVQADLNKLLGKLDGGTASELRQQIANMAEELEKIYDKIGEVAAGLNNAIDEVNGMYEDALDFVSQFTNINFAINFSNDPCSKFGVGFKQGILNPAFIDQARAANPLNQAINPGFGSTTR